MKYTFFVCSLPPIVEVLFFVAVKSEVFDLSLKYLYIILMLWKTLEQCQFVTIHTWTLISLWIFALNIAWVITTSGSEIKQPGLIKDWLLDTSYGVL